MVVGLGDIVVCYFLKKFVRLVLKLLMLERNFGVVRFSVLVFN